jgi:phosphate:Na+ symporter
MTLLNAFSLLGGVGLFLYGMTVMSDGLKDAAGDNLQSILEKATSNKMTSIFVGLAMTVLVQSSSATDIMVIGFVNSGMMNLFQALGVIMGANIGTTVTAQITAFNLAAYAPVIMFLGVVAFLFIKNTTVKYVGEFLMGFGMLFVGISIMKEAIKPLSESEAFIRTISGLDNPFLAVLFGVAFTALLQSSSSSTVIFQAFAVQGLLSYHTAVYLVIGAAIGSVTPNLIASLTVNRNGKRSAILNLVFNLFRAVLMMLLVAIVPQFLDFVQSLSPDDIGRQIANTHTLFAIIAVIIEMPFMKLLVKIVEKIIPILPEESESLKDRSLQYMVNVKKMPSSIALNQAHREVARMGRISAKNVSEAVECFFNYDATKAERIRTREESVDILNDLIDEAMNEMREFTFGSEALKRISEMVITVTDMERLSDHAVNIIEYAEQMQGKHSVMSKDARDELFMMARDAVEIVNLSVDVFETGETIPLQRVEKLENRLDWQEKELVDHHIVRLMNNTCDPFAGIVYTNLVTDLERCGDHAYNIAYALADARVKDADEVDQEEKAPVEKAEVTEEIAEEENSDAE